MDRWKIGQFKSLKKETRKLSLTIKQHIVFFYSEAIINKLYTWLEIVHSYNKSWDTWEYIFQTILEEHSNLIFHLEVK